MTAILAGRVHNDELSVEANNDLAADPAYLFHKQLRVDYSLDGVRKSATVKEGETLTLPPDAQAIGTPPAYRVALDKAGRPQLFARASGTFTLTEASGRSFKMNCDEIPPAVEISGPWTVSFPPGWNAPAQVTFDRLESWTANSNSAVKYFSGTATYEKEIEISGDELGSGRELWLDLGNVKNFAEVSLNGQSLGILWKPPFVVNLTGAAHPGKNALLVKVTNLWPNRLIGDEQLPDDREWNGKQLKEWPQWLLDGKPSPAGRLTFTTWHHWTRDDDLLDSGLLGPVMLERVQKLAVR